MKREMRKKKNRPAVAAGDAGDAPPPPYVPPHLVQEYTQERRRKWRNLAPFDVVVRCVVAWGGMSQGCVDVGMCGCANT
jgi:hypothetical protein